MDALTDTSREKSPHASRDLVILALLLAFPSAGFVQKHAGLAGLAGYTLAVISALFAARWIGGQCADWLRRHFRMLSLLGFAGLAVVFAVVHPIEDGKGPGKSSDRDEGLDLAVSRMVEGNYPYYPSNPLAGPLSVLPGGILLAAPFVALGTSAYQNYFWLAAFLLATAAVFRDKALALLLLAVALAPSPAAQYEYISGGDLLANPIYVLLFYLLAIRSWTMPGRKGTWKWAACLLLGIGLASRSNYLLLLPLFGALLWRKAGLFQAVAACGAVLAVFAAVTLPFYLHDPAGFTPLLTREKLAFANGALPWAGSAIISLTALVSLAGVLVILRRPQMQADALFLRACALVTLCPMVCLIALSTWSIGAPDFSFLRDRFGLMYVFFALLGWGGCLLRPAAEPRLSGNGNPA